LGKCGLVSAHDQLAILWNGDVVLCCGDFEGATKVGNVRDKTLQDVIDGDKMNEVERKFKAGVIPFELCKTCLGGQTYRECFKNQIGTYIVNFKQIRSIFNKL